ncbi:MAG: RHS repeat-associated core domain-containing protein, partial [Planctomycetales bacterium]
VNMFTWVGEQGYVRDTETGEYQLRLRQYQPDKARFKSQDPLGVEPDPNLYRYVGNNPVLSVDPGGTDSNARIDENNPGGADTVKISVTHATNSRLNGPIGTYWRSDGSVGRQIDGKWYVVPYLQVVMAVRRDEVKASSDWDDWFKKHASADAEPPVGNLPGAKPAPGSRPDARNYEPLEPGLTVKLPKLKCESPLTAAACTRLFTAEERDAWLKDIENIPKEAFDAATDWVPFVNDVKDWINIFRATSIVTGENITKLEKICMAVSVDTATRRAPPAQEDSEVPGKGRLPRQENKGSS